MAITFRDLNVSKKKPPELFKCWILAQNEIDRELYLDWGIDRYGLSEKSAIALELNKIGSETLLTNSNNLVEFFNGKYFVVVKFVLDPDTFDTDVILPPENSAGFDLDPHYDPDLGVLNATIRYRMVDMSIKTYLLADIALEIDDSTHIVRVKDIELVEHHLNQSKK